MKILDVIDEERPLLLALPTTNEKPTPPKGYNMTSTPVVVIHRSQPEPEGRQFINGYMLLVFVAILFGTLNVSLRGVYASTHPPSASALSTVRGWLAVLCFLPLLRRKTSSSTSISHTSDSDENGNNNMTIKRISNPSSDK